MRFILKHRKTLIYLDVVAIAAVLAWTINGWIS